MRLFELIKIAYFLFRYSSDSQNYRWIEKTRNLNLIQSQLKAVTSSLMKDREGARLFERKPLFCSSSLTIASLESAQDGSLAKEYARFLKLHGLKPVFYNRKVLEVQGDESYFVHRILQTHDLWHVVLGYNTSELHEIELQTFLFRQTGWPTAPYIIGGYIIREAAKNCTNLPNVFEAVTRGWARAADHASMFLLDWDLLWDRQVEEIRELTLKKAEPKFA